MLTNTAVAVVEAAATTNLLFVNSTSSHCEGVCFVSIPHITRTRWWEWYAVVLWDYTNIKILHLFDVSYEYTSPI
jgi:hypothetical protein